MIPGPVEVYKEVYDVLGEPIIGHRTSDFGALYREVSKKAGKVFETKNDVYLLTSSGSGAIETAVVNTISPGDKVLSVVIGVFGDRFAKMARTYGGDVTELKIDWGKGATPQQVRKALDVSGADIITITHNETSTGCTNPIGEIAEEVADDALMLVDGVSSVGGIKYQHDKWNIGVSLTGSQKALCVPPGLALITFSKRAWEKVEQTTTPRYYFDIRKYKKYYDEKGETPYTPAIGLVMAIDKSLDIILET
ncbi:MAG: alanine--glyoxylate aminotransferase family protein, partial [archaeon]